MADNLFMSDYQKIIFANNIDENKIEGLSGYGNGQSINNIKSLSKAYPFVVFFTKYKGTETKNNEIDNIWIDGIRATRFVGVNPNSSITIGDRTIKLDFDYETGLLSFKDANQLIAIKLIGIKYNKANKSNYTTGENLIGEEKFVAYSNNISINSVDNKFKLIFEFEVAEDADISAVSKALNINSIYTTDKHFNIINNPKHVTDRSEYSNTLTKKCYEYECQIIYDTERSTDNHNYYNAISQYDNTIKYPDNNGFKLNLRLNPINYDVVLQETGAKIINNIDLKANKEYIFNVNIYPNGNINDQYTYPISDYNKAQNEQKKLLDFIVESTNTNYIEVLSPFNSEQGQPILNNTFSFTLKTKNATNSIIPINIKLKNNSITDNYIYNISKTFNINLGGGTVYLYCGYTIPTDDNSFKSQMRDITNNINNKDLTPLYDWKTNNWGVSDDSEKYFYIAFTSGYEDVICSCWDCYINNNGLSKQYIPIGLNNNGLLKNDNNDNGRFVRQTNSPIGLSVYKSSVKGQFFGKIQIQNN